MRITNYILPIYWKNTIENKSNGFHVVVHVPFLLLLSLLLLYWGYICDIYKSSYNIS
jgi:hypothetical protein